MDNPTDAPVILKKEGNITEKVELVPTGQLGQIQEFVRERRTVSEDKNTVTTDVLAESQSGYDAGTKIIENRVKGVNVKSTRYNPQGEVRETINFDKKGKAVNNKTFDDSGGFMAINQYGTPFGEMSKLEIVEKKGDLIEHTHKEGDFNYYHAEINLEAQSIKSNQPTTEIGWKMPKNIELEDVIQTSSNGVIRVDLPKIIEIDPSINGLPNGARFSKSAKREFGKIMDSAVLDLNRIIEQTEGVRAESRFSEAQAKIRGGKIGKYKVFLPPSAQDFKGLLYQFLAKGRVGEAQMAFFKKALIDPFAKAVSEINNFKQALNNKYKAALKEFPGVKDILTELIPNTNFTVEQAVRVYLWNKAGFEVPGLSRRDLKTLVDFVENDKENKDIRAFAETLGIASEQEAGYLEPSEYWMVENIRSDILKIANERKRSDFLTEWKNNVDVIFSKENLNKIEAIYGSRFREALEDILHRMEFGTSRESGGSRLVNTFNNWANQSVGAIMFLNMRSALLQTISSINYLNWSDNNPLKAGMALANVPQFLKDFAMIFNSDMLKQRRAGNQRGINEAELAEAMSGSKLSPKAILNWLLTKGFLPTQIADSFAISSGGATFYRNRVNTYLKEGYSQEEAEQMAFQDFQENTEESQQSARPDMISQQQASPLGRYILAFKNTPMQYARLIQKSAKDLIAGRGDAKTNMGKIVYYAAVQNLIFSTLQTSIGMLIGDDDEEKDINKYERTINSMIDSLLGGLGIGGVAVSTLKNTIMEFLKQEKKSWNSDHAYTLLRFFGLSPTVGSKGRKLYSGIQTWKFNEDVIKKMSLLNIDNPVYSIVGNVISAVTNLPLDRVVKKVDNIDAAITEDLSTLQRLALLMGWNTWDLDVDDSDILAIEDEIKKEKEVERKKKQEIKKEQKKKEKEIEDKAKEEENKKKDDGICIAIGKSGNRCKKKAESGGYCTIHTKVEQGTKEVQCKKIKSDKTRCKMKTKAKSGYCYYHD
jgi:hypothetical protein